MVKKNRKRKSEESSPITKIKLRKTFRKSNGCNQSRIDEGDESDSLFVAESPHIQQPSLTCEEIYKTKPDMKFRTKSNYDDLENYTESQSFLAMIAKQNDYNKRATKVTKEFLQKFTRDIGDHTSKLKNHIQNLNLTSVKTDNDFFISFKAAFTLSNPSSSHQDSTSDQKFDFSSLLTHYQDIILKAHQAVKLFESVDQKIATMEARNLLINLRWDKEVSEAENLLKLGRQVGIERYNAMIQGDKMTILNVDDKTFSSFSSSTSNFSRQALVDQLLYQSDKSISRSDATWGTIAQKQLRAFKKLAKVSKST